MKIKNSNKIIFVGIIVVIVLVIIAISTAWKNRQVDVSELSDEERIEYMENKINDIEKQELSQKGERDRMEKYVSDFIACVENGKYEEAYEMLYDDFKTNYFPTVSSFSDYAKLKFSRLSSVEYTNIERLGDMYVLWVNMGDALGSKDAYKEMKFVVQEKGLNDFKLSFSAEL